MLFSRLIAPTLAYVVFYNLLNFFALAVDHEGDLLPENGVIVMAV